MYIEDIVSNLIFQKYNWPFGNQITFVSNYELNFLNNIANQIDNSLGLTEKQSNLTIKILKKYLKKINAALNIDVTNYLENPEFKFPRRELSVAKTIKIETTEYGKYIYVSFPYDEKIISIIKNYQNTITGDWVFMPERQEILWNHVKKVWQFSLKEEHIIWLMTNLSDFIVDEEFQKYTDEITKIQKFIENYIPMVVYDGGYYFKNTDKRIKQPSTTSLVETLLIARKYGITTWDDTIEKMLNSSEINSITRKFLKKNYEDHLILNNDTNLETLYELINFFNRIMIVIPSNLEYESLEIFHKFLTDYGFHNSSMTVMFRLDNTSGKSFNDYIRNNNLNSSISDDIKFIFVSEKLPKPLLAMEKEIDLIIYLGNGGEHYNLRRYIKNHHNVIMMNLLDNKESDFANM